MKTTNFEKEPIRKGTQATWGQTMTMLSVLSNDEKQLIMDAMLYGCCGCVEMEFAHGGDILKIPADGFCMADAEKAGNFTKGQIMEITASIRAKMCQYDNCIGRNISFYDNWIDGVDSPFLFIREEYRNCIVLWKDGITMPDFRIEDTMECAMKWIKGGYPCIFRYGWRWKGASASRISQDKALGMLPRYSFGMGFYQLSFIREKGVDVLEFNELGENDLL